MNTDPSSLKNLSESEAQAILDANDPGFTIHINSLGEGAIYDECGFLVCLLDEEGVY